MRRSLNVPESAAHGAVKFDSLDDWLSWQETAHPVKIDLGLERVREVARRMGLLNPDYTVITIAGTNGKGSSVALLEDVLSIAGHRVGAYTSPHIHRYNERIRIARQDSSDEKIMAAFAAIDTARETISLSYFEFSTLAALYLFTESTVDIGLLEVGLGGRLDAVNIIDADIALLTSIGIDHTQWLGEEREQIALEKAAVARPDRPAVCGEHEPPETLRQWFHQQGVRYFQIAESFGIRLLDDGRWDWWFADHELRALPKPGLPGAHQLRNAAGVLTACQLLPEAMRPDESAIRLALQRFSLAGRFEVYSQPCEVILDVAHNADGIRMLAQLLAERPVAGRTFVLLGIMADKDVFSVIHGLHPIVDAWMLSAPDYARAMSVEALAEAVSREFPLADVHTAETLAGAWQALQPMLQAADRVVVTGSFYTVAEIRSLLQQ